MRKRYAIALTIIVALIFIGCMGASNLSLQEIKSKNLSPRDVIDSNKYAYKIFDDSKNATLFVTMGTQMANQINIMGVERVVKDLSKYCEAIGGKWKYGKKFVMLVKEFGTTNPILTFKALKEKNINIDGIGKCFAPNGKGFHLYEIGLYDLKIKPIANSLGGGEVYYWHRYFKIEYDKPNISNRDYVLSSYEPFLKNYADKDVDKIVRDYDKIKNIGRDNYFLITTYPICKYLGGTEYIATDVGTNMKKMKMKDYLFKIYDEELKRYEYNITAEKGIVRLKMFPISKKGYIWCENKKNPDKQFMLIWNKNRGYFNAIRGINYKLINNLQENIETNASINHNDDGTKNEIENTINNIFKNNLRIDDNNVLSIARAIMLNKKDILINTGWVIYKGFYISNIDGKQKVIVERIYNNKRYFYNFDINNSRLSFKGKTLQGITQVEKNRFNLEEIKKECKLNKTYMQIVNGLKIYCKYNDGVYKFFIFNENNNVLDVF